MSLNIGEIMSETLGQILKEIASSPDRLPELEYPLIQHPTLPITVHCAICEVDFWASITWVDQGADYCIGCRASAASNLGQRLQNFFRHR